MADEAIDVCPTDVFRASVERVWELIIDPARLPEWIDVRVKTAPSRRLAAGDRVLFAAPLGLRVTWDVLSVDEPRALGIDVRVPFGIRNLETIVISRIDAEHCRVTFN